MMIALLAMLSDGAILSIAYDNATPSPMPVRWQMRAVLSVATMLGLAGLAASFTLFAVTNSVFDLGHEQIQTIM